MTVGWDEICIQCNQPAERMCLKCREPLCLDCYFPDQMCDECLAKEEYYNNNWSEDDYEHKE